jgi:hypothetical protein
VIGTRKIDDPKGKRGISFNSSRRKSSLSEGSANVRTPDLVGEKSEVDNNWRIGDVEEEKKGRCRRRAHGVGKGNG